MNHPTETPEQTSLRGLLVLLREIEHDLALQSTGEISHEETLTRIRELAESAAWTDQVQLAKALVDLTPPPNRRTYYAIVTQYSTAAKHAAGGDRGGPELWGGSMSSIDARDAIQAHAERRFRDYGWSAIATVTFDEPVPVFAALPASVAGMHR